MIVTKLNNALRCKVGSEFALFKSILLMQKPQAILDHAVAYATKSDMVTIIHETQFSEQEARAMLNIPHLLDVMYKEYGEHSSNSMDVLVSFMTDKAEELAAAPPVTQKDRGGAR